MALREDRIGQTCLVPKRVTDFIPENHICYFISNLAEELDFKKIEQIEETLGQLPDNMPISADNGYYTQKTYNI
ncbi:MAG: hypothetical protein WC389_20855 [Lutibacter sp.]|jgi:hypothetical protein